MKLLVTGGAGYLGSELCRQAVERGFEVLATQLHSPPPHGRAVQLDVRDAEATDHALMRHGPDVVVHTAYLLAGPELERTNVQGSHAVAQAARRCGARLVHLSTDLVFDGEQGAPYNEEAEPRPVMEYGAAKLAAERIVAKDDPEALIVRTSLLYGKPEPGPQELLAFRDDVEFYTDEIRCPTLVSELARALLALAATELAGPLHVAAPGAISRYELARALRGRTASIPRLSAGSRALAVGEPETSPSTRPEPPKSSRSRSRPSERHRPIGLPAATIDLPFSPVRRNGPRGPIFFRQTQKRAADGRNT